MRHHRVLGLAVALLILAAACGRDDDTVIDHDPSTTAGAAGQAPGLDDLEGRTFAATSVTEDGEPRPLVAGTELRLSFADGQLALGAGCNQMAGPYALDGTTLTAGPFNGTLMGCDPPLMDQDDWIADVFTGDLDLTLEGDTLTLVAGPTTLTLEDEAVDTTDAKLTGTEWTVDTLIQGDVASTPPPGVVATLRFSDDGSYAVATGCNTGSGTFETGDAVLVLTPPTLTKMACKGDAATVEQAMLPVLDGEVSFTVAGDRLTLTPELGDIDGGMPLGGSGLGLAAD